LAAVDPVPDSPDPAPDPGLIADAVLGRVKHYTIGFGRAGHTPSAMGSGVLIRDGDRHGILTCAHVDSYIRNQKQPIGLIRLNRGPAEQFGMLYMDELFTSAAGEAPWNEGDVDIAFIHLRPDLVGNIAKDCSFLDIGMNFAKPEPSGYPTLIKAHSVFGLVEEFTGATTRERGRATTPMKGVLTSGVLRQLDKFSATLECYAENIPDLPHSFGATSGGGMWRVYLLQRPDKALEVVHHRLLGIASREVRGSPPSIKCQGLGRIEALIEEVRRGERKS
jgi:hypothetical protein